MDEVCQLNLTALESVEYLPRIITNISTAQTFNKFAISQTTLFEIETPEIIPYVQYEVVTSTRKKP